WTQSRMSWGKISHTCSSVLACAGMGRSASAKEQSTTRMYAFGRRSANVKPSFRIKSCFLFLRLLAIPLLWFDQFGIVSRRMRTIRWATDKGGGERREECEGITGVDFSEQDGHTGSCCFAISRPIPRRFKKDVFG